LAKDAFSKLGGVAYIWHENETIKDRLSEGGVGAMICTNKGEPCGEERPISCQVKKWESFLQAHLIWLFSENKGCDLTITAAI